MSCTPNSIVLPTFKLSSQKEITDLRRSIDRARITEQALICLHLVASIQEKELRIIEIVGRIKAILDKRFN